MSSYGGGDNDTLFTTDTALQIGPDGKHCLRHPTVELVGRDEDGNKFQRDACPQCEDDLQRKLDLLKSKRAQVNKKLANLDLQNGSDEDDEEDCKATIPALKKKHSSIPHESCEDEGGWTRLNSSTQMQNKGLSLEALATQMNRMQQMQDWLLMQKEQEMQALRQRVEDQQQELVKKEVELALLKEKLAQQETRMEHELKLIKLAAYHRRHKNKNSSGGGSSNSGGGSGKHHHSRDGSNEECGGGMKEEQQKEAKNIHIAALHVNVGGTTEESSPHVSREAIEQATIQALNQQQNQPQVLASYEVDDVMVADLPSSEEDEPIKNEMSSRNVPKQESVGESQASYALASGSVVDHTANKMINPPPLSPKPEERSGSDDYVQVEVPPPEDNNNDNTMDDIPAPQGHGPPPTTLTPMDSTVDDDDEDNQTPSQQTPPQEAGEDAKKGMVSPTTTTMSPEEDETAYKSEMRDTLAPMPTAKSARFKIQSDNNRLPGPPEEDFLGGGVPPPGPSDFIGGPPAAASAAAVGRGGYSTNKEGIPYDIDGNPNLNPVPLEEQITIDSRLLGDSGRFQNTQRLYPNTALGVHSNQGGESDAQTVGNTVATSTYGEDRQKVVNQIVLDPYGDSGVYTGVILLSTGMPHGLGRMVYQDDGRTYEGDWRHGRWHGFGNATFANGDSYEGEYRFDQRHGRGLYQWNDGRQYDGEFDEDKRHGKGTFKWPDGAIYEGDFVYGQREGTGRYTFSDGGCYEGDWVDGRYEGYGECTWEDGRVYKGEWVQGMAHGRGVETYANGEIRHEGLWESDEPIRGT